MFKGPIALPDASEQNVWSCSIIPGRYQFYKVSFMVKSFYRNATLGINIYKGPKDDSPHVYLHIRKSNKWKQFFVWVFHDNSSSKIEKYLRLFKVDGDRVIFKEITVEKVMPVRPVLCKPAIVADYLTISRFKKEHLSYQSFLIRFESFKTYQVSFTAKCSITKGWLAVGIKSNNSSRNFKHIPLINSKEWNDYSVVIYSEKIIDDSKIFLHFETNGTNQYFTGSPFEVEIKNISIETIKPKPVSFLPSTRPKPKTISVVIPFFSDHAIEKVFSGLRNQDCDRDVFEVICVDDSRDKTKGRKVEQLTSRQPFHVRYLKKKATKSWPSICSARNLGIKHAKGEMLVLLDNDIFLPPGYLSRQADIHKKYSNVAVQSVRRFVSGKTLKLSYEKLCGISKEGDRSLNTQLNFYNRIFPEGLILLPETEEFLLSTYAVSLPLSTVIKSGGFDSKLFDGGYAHEDTELGYRLFKLGMRGILDFKNPVIHFNHPRPTGIIGSSGINLYERNLRILMRQGHKRNKNIFVEKRK